MNSAFLSELLFTCFTILVETVFFLYFDSLFDEKKKKPTIFTLIIHQLFIVIQTFNWRQTEIGPVWIIDFTVLVFFLYFYDIPFPFLSAVKEKYKRPYAFKENEKCWINAEYDECMLNGDLFKFFHWMNCTKMIWSTCAWTLQSKWENKWMEKTTKRIDKHIYRNHWLTVSFVLICRHFLYIFFCYSVSAQEIEHNVI